MNIPPEVWFPAATSLGGLLIGTVGTAAVTMWQDRRIARREILRQRAELERQTLLEILDLSVLLTLQYGLVFQHKWVSDDDVRMFADIERDTPRLIMLSRRLNDEEIHKAASRLTMALVNLAKATNPTSSNEANRSPTPIEEAYKNCAKAIRNLSALAHARLYEE